MSVGSEEDRSFRKQSSEVFEVPDVVQVSLASSAAQAIAGKEAQNVVSQENVGTEAQQSVDDAAKNEEKAQPPAPATEADIVDAEVDIVPGGVSFFSCLIQAISQSPLAFYRSPNSFIFDIHYSSNFL